MRERYYKRCEKAYRRIACNLAYMQVLCGRCVESAKRAGDLTLKRQLVNLGKKCAELEAKAVEFRDCSVANAKDKGVEG